MAPNSFVPTVDGRYRNLPEDLGKKIWRWVRNGGALIATQRATTWVDRQVRETPGEAEDRENADPPPAAGSEGSTADPEALPERRPYGQNEDERAAQLINGAIFQVDLDLTKPAMRRAPAPRAEHRARAAWESTWTSSSSGTRLAKRRAT